MYNKIRLDQLKQKDLKIEKSQKEPQILKYRLNGVVGKQSQTGDILNKNK